MTKREGDELVATFVGPFVNGTIPSGSPEQLIRSVHVAILALARAAEGKATPKTKYHAASALLIALMLNPYALIEAGYAGPSQDN